MPPSIPLISRPIPELKPRPPSPLGFDLSSTDEDDDGPPSFSLEPPSRQTMSRSVSTGVRSRPRMLLDGVNKTHMRSMLLMTHVMYDRMQVFRNHLSMFCQDPFGLLFFTMPNEALDLMEEKSSESPNYTPAAAVSAGSVMSCLEDLLMDNEETLRDFCDFIKCTERYYAPLLQNHLILDDLDLEDFFGPEHPEFPVTDPVPPFDGNVMDISLDAFRRSDVSSGTWLEYLRPIGDNLFNLANEQDDDVLREFVYEVFPKVLNEIQRFCRGENVAATRLEEGEGGNQRTNASIPMDFSRVRVGYHPLFSLSSPAGIPISSLLGAACNNERSPPSRSSSSSSSSSSLSPPSRDGDKENTGDAGNQEDRDDDFPPGLP